METVFFVVNFPRLTRASGADISARNIVSQVNARASYVGDLVPKIAVIQNKAGPITRRFPRHVRQLFRPRVDRGVCAEVMRPTVMCPYLKDT